MTVVATPALAIDGLVLSAGARSIVDGIDLMVGQGEIVGLVGESGSGKSQTALAIGGLTPPGITRTAGTITLGDRRIAAGDDRTLRAVRGRELAYVFQEPMTALNPTIRIGRQMVDIIARARDASTAAATAIARDMLKSVHLAEPDRVLAAYPHELSGGMRQRVLIALAFACRPKVIVADEPTTALDVLVQAQVLALLAALAAGSDCGVLFISHDLAVVRQICARVYVMQAGRVVENGTTEDILLRPRHDYTRRLLASTAEGVAA